MIRKSYFRYFTALFVLWIFAGCKPASGEGSGRIKVVCGLPPTAFIASAIGGDRVQVSSMLPEGRSPHDYAPRPSDISEAGRAACFFTTGMNFEQSAVRAMPKNVKIVDVTSGIKRRKFDDGMNCCDGHGHDHHHDEASLDPHVWLSPANATAIAAVVLENLIAADPVNRDYYRENFHKFKNGMIKVDAEIKEKLSPWAGREFMVYHPAFGYFADAYKLRQYPLEINGREMNAAQLAKVIAKAKQEGIKVVFVQPQFNPRTAAELARRISGTAVPLDPLAYDLAGNFKAMAKAISRGFGGKK